MADHTLIPPVSGNRSVPKVRSVPPKRDERRKKPDRHAPENGRDKKEDGRPNIDEYA